VVATVRRGIARQHQILTAERELLPDEIGKAKPFPSADVRIVHGCCRDAARLEVDSRGALLRFVGPEEDEFHGCAARKDGRSARSIDESVCRESKASPQLGIKPVRLAKLFLDSLEIFEHGLNRRQYQSITWNAARHCCF
jgi:hypothetical protein